MFNSLSIEPIQIIYVRVKLCQMWNMGGKISMGKDFHQDPVLLKN
jgi:hypothetical protein